MENIYTSAKPFYICLKVFGIYPMTFGPTTKKFCKTKCQDILITCCSLSVLIALIVIHLVYGIDLKADSPILFKTFQVSVVFDLFMIFAQYFVQLVKRNGIRNFLELLHKFDIDVNKLVHLHCNIEIKTVLGFRQSNWELFSTIKNRRKLYIYHW